MFVLISDQLKGINEAETGFSKCRYGKKKIMMFLAIPLFIVYFLCYLSYFPGMLSYDMPLQTAQAIGLMQLNNHQPVLHTLIWKFFINLGRSVGVEGLVLYTVVQLTVVQLCMLYVIYKLLSIRIPFLAVVLSYFYYLLLPVLHIFSIANTKDVYFSCAICLFLIWLVELESFDRLSLEISCMKNVFKVLAAGIAAVMLRNNGLYVMLAMLVLCVFIKNRKKFGIIFACIVIYGIIYSDFVLPAAGVSTDSKINESLSVPMSQLSYVYARDECALSEIDKEMIRTYIPKVEDFNPRLADNIKWTFNRELYRENPINFWKLYLSIGLKEPVCFAAAFLDLNIDYWYPFADFPDPYSARGYIETVVAQLDYYPLERQSKIPDLNEWYKEVSWFTANWMRYPVIYQIFSLSFPCISMFFTSFIMIKNRRAEMVIPFLVLVMLFGTYLLGPVSNFRYVYTYYLTLPFYFGSAMLRE